MWLTAHAVNNFLIKKVTKSLMLFYQWFKWNVIYNMTKHDAQWHGKSNHDWLYGIFVSTLVLLIIILLSNQLSKFVSVLPLAVHCLRLKISSQTDQQFVPRPIRMQQQACWPISYVGLRVIIQPVWSAERLSITVPIPATFGQWWEKRFTQHTCMHSSSVIPEWRSII